MNVESSLSRQSGLNGGGWQVSNAFGREHEQLVFEAGSFFQQMVQGNDGKRVRGVTQVSFCTVCCLDTQSGAFCCLVLSASMWTAT